MPTANTYLYRQTQPILFASWIFNHLSKFKFSLEKWLVNNMDRVRQTLESELLQYSTLSSKDALIKLNRIRRALPSLERLERSISKTSNYKIMASFNAWKKTIYKCEANLHRIAYLNSETNPTPDYLKNALSNLGLKSIFTQNQSENVL
jgi:hypothetical protein